MSGFQFAAALLDWKIPLDCWIGISGLAQDKLQLTSPVVKFSGRADSKQGSGVGKHVFRVRCCVRCSKPNALTCVRMILTCSVFSVFEAQDVGVVIGVQMFCCVRCSKRACSGPRSRDPARVPGPGSQVPGPGTHGLRSPDSERTATWVVDCPGSLGRPIPYR